MEEGRKRVEMRLERKSSIETEPMTLRLSQIQDAREAALYVLETRTMEEAMHIFTQGLEAVRGEEEDEEEEGGGYVEVDCDDNDNDNDYDCDYDYDYDYDYGLQLVRQHLVEHAFREVVSAPF